VNTNLHQQKLDQNKEFTGSQKYIPTLDVDVEV